MSDKSEPNAPHSEIFREICNRFPLGMVIAEWEAPPDVETFRYIYWNKVSASDSFPLEYLVGKRVSDIPPVMAMGLPEIYAEAIRSGERQKLPPFRYADAEVPERVVDCSIIPLGPKHIVAMYEDVTTRDQMERQVMANHRMEALTRLIGGVAHDYNNMLTVIQTYAGFLADNPDLPASAKEDIAAIMDAAAGSHKLTMQLLDFSHPSQNKKEPVDVGAVASNVSSMLARTMGANYKLHVYDDGGDGTVLSNRSRIEQLVMNLALNAQEAMPDGGSLTIATSTEELVLGQDSQRVTGLPPGRYLRLSVTDTGRGMKDSDRLRVFEPFFTTKAHAGGHGLGLATVYGTVKDAGGHISVSSRLDEGTTFSVLLPTCGSDDDVAADPKIDPVRGNGETVLVVDDEARVRAALERGLTRLGYRVVTAADGAEALDLIDELGDIQVVLTDVAMPRMGGVELGKKVQGDTELPVIYMSGYVADAMFSDATPVTMLSKPFTVQGVARAVGAALEKR